MEKESQILDSVSVLENELSNLVSRLGPVTVAAPPAVTVGGSVAPAEPSRSMVNERLTNMIRQVRDVQSRLEV